MPKLSEKDRRAAEFAREEDSLLAKRAVKENLITRAAARAALDAQEALLEKGYVFRVGELLVKGGDASFAQWTAFVEGLGAGAADVAPAAATEGEDAEEDAVLRLLLDSDHCPSQGELAAALGWGQRRANGVVAFLVDNGLVIQGKHERKKVYWHPERPFYPQWGLVGPAKVAVQTVTEAEVVEKAGEHLESTLFVFEAEEVASCELTHLPLWKVAMHGQFPEGLVFKKTRKRSGTLYFHGSRGHLCSIVPKQGIVFGAFGGEAPDSVQDLDETCEWEERLPADLALNSRVMDSLKSQSRVESSLTKRFGMKVDDIELVFLPCWKVFIEDRGGGQQGQRLLVLDGVTARPVVL